jgi:hypothetical protein
VPVFRKNTGRYRPFHRRFATICFQLARKAGPPARFGYVPLLQLKGPSAVFRSALFSLAALASIATSAQANGLDFKLINDTGYDINSVYLDPNASDSWTDDVMTDDILADGTGVAINFVGDHDSCLWDLKVDWTEDYPSTVWTGLNLCSISTVTLKYNRDSDVTTAEVE